MANNQSNCLPYLASGIFVVLSLGCGRTQFADGKSYPARSDSAVDQSLPPSDVAIDPPIVGSADVVPALELQEFTVSEAKKPVDIFFLMDTSGSMLDEKKNLEASMKGFMQALESSMIDAKVTAVGSTSFQFPADIAPEKFRVMNLTVGSNDAISIANQVFAMSSLPLPLRDTAGLEVIFITDDDGRGTGNLAANFRAPKQQTTVSGIVGLKVGRDPANADCNIVRVGEQYKTLAKAYGGSIFDLCLKDWSGMLQQLSSKIKVRTRGFKLEKKRKATGKLAVKLDGRELEHTAYNYDEATNAIVFGDDLDVKAGMKVSVEFEKE